MNSVLTMKSGFAGVSLPHTIILYMIATQNEARNSNLQSEFKFRIPAVLFGFIEPANFVIG